ncbi:50S ribosomal protein L21 [Beggiatoa leptomitoformis]|uniref:Large ribosomal subunit protein bL21 n=1 Tax=Beggiatoa leptomitoformis TaxID=288004 RepID=A0A2N9YE74_9GAMM|nr:50S ribosomal protein L21 [Beggiatoa leptomitoformis]ALG68849.1 50S ribosomal protein L21 [Beggiatoa leptomitoformis]AUI68782.1 50S ribosomal protein L21 [Beggiatoa leptomitoformis]
MYAVIKTGGKQYKVAEGDVLKIEKIIAEEGTAVEFSEVLLLANGDDITIGTPVVSGSKVTATVQAQGRGDKIKIMKMRRRKHYRRQMGHRQYYTEVKITGIVA